MGEIIPEYWKNLSLENIIYTNEDGKECVEEWRDINEYVSFYQISNLGRIKSKPRYKGVTSDGVTPRFYKEKILKQNFTKRGYLRIGLYDKNTKCHKYFAHVLVCTYFNGGRGNFTEVNHKNGVKTYNIYYNLEWVTGKINIAHAWNNRLCGNISQNHHRAKLTNDHALEISLSKLKGTDLAALYKVSTKVISNIKRGKTWASITGIKYISNV